jgi:hypothetical protein
MPPIHTNIQVATASMTVLRELKIVYSPGVEDAIEGFLQFQWRTNLTSKTRQTLYKSIYPAVSLVTTGGTISLVLVVSGK